MFTCTVSVSILVAVAAINRVCATDSHNALLDSITIIIAYIGDGGVEFEGLYTRMHIGTTIRVLVCVQVVPHQFFCGSCTGWGGIQHLFYYFVYVIFYIFYLLYPYMRGLSYPIIHNAGYFLYYIPYYTCILKGSHRSIKLSDPLSLPGKSA